MLPMLTESKGCSLHEKRRNAAARVEDLAGVLLLRPAVLERPWIFPCVVLGCCIEPYVLEGSPGCGFPLSG